MKTFNALADIKAATLTDQQICMIKSKLGAAANDIDGAAFFKVLTPADWGSAADNIHTHAIANGNIIVPLDLEINSSTISGPVGSHVITANLSLFVDTGGNDVTGLGTAALPWASPHRAFEWLSGTKIMDGVTVTISVAAGAYTFTTPIELTHPDGNKIQMVGGAMLGTKPTGVNAGADSFTATLPTSAGNRTADRATNEALIRARYGVQFTFNGCNGLISTGGNLGLTDNIAYIGNLVVGFYGVHISGVADSINNGAISCGVNTAVHGFGFYGLITNYGGSIYAGSATVTGNGEHGIITNYGGSIYAESATVTGNGRWGIATNYGGSIDANSATSMGNGGNGIITYYGGFIDANSATSMGNGGNGITTNAGGFISAVSTNVTDNGANGIFTNVGGSIDAGSAIVTGNGGSGIVTNLGGSINALSATIDTSNTNGVDVWSTGGGSIQIDAPGTGNVTAGVVMSPAHNGPVGNGNSWIGI